MNDKELLHYGVPGMQWGKHLFGKARETVGRVGSAARHVSTYKQREASAKRDLLKQIAKGQIDHDRAYGYNIRNQNDSTQKWKNDVIRRIDRASGVTGINGQIRQADQVFGKGTNWGSSNYMQPKSYKVDAVKRYVNEFIKSVSNKSIFTEDYRYNADYGSDFIKSMNVTTGILNNPYLDYKDWLN